MGSTSYTSRFLDESFGGSSSSRTATNSPLPESLFTSRKDGPSGMAARRPFAETGDSRFAADFDVARSRFGSGPSSENDSIVNRRALTNNDITNFYSF